MTLNFCLTPLGLFSWLRVFDLEGYCNTEEENCSAINKDKFPVFPLEISKLKNLTCLDISNNKISVIPPAFRLITSLVVFELKDNPLTSPPAQVCCPPWPIYAYCTRFIMLNDG